MANKRLIDANATKARCNSWSCQSYIAGMALAKMNQLIDSMPTVDAVEVVRCKDCKQWNVHPINGRLTLGKCLKFSKVMDDTSFCSYGERRTDG